MTTTFLSIDSKLDINSICNLSFDFHLLKEVIEVLVSSQKTLIKRITALETNSKTKDKQIIE
jgi:hypothetical protein